MYDLFEDNYKEFVLGELIDLWDTYYYTVSQKMHQLWNGIAKNYKDQFWWNLAEIFKRL